MRLRAPTMRAKPRVNRQPSPVQSACVRTRKARRGGLLRGPERPRPPATGSPPAPSPDSQPRRARRSRARGGMAQRRHPPRPSARDARLPRRSSRVRSVSDQLRSAESTQFEREPAFNRAAPGAAARRLRRQHEGGGALGGRGRRELRGCYGCCGECGTVRHSDL